MTKQFTRSTYMRAATTFDNHEAAHLLDAYLAGLTCETLEFLHEVRKLAYAHPTDTVSFSLESGDMLWNMAMLMAWWGYDFDSPEFNNPMVQRSVGTMTTHDMAEFILANLSRMMNTRERMLRNGSTKELTGDLKVTLVRMFHAWQELNYRCGFTIDVIADLNVRKLCKVYSVDYYELLALLTRESV
jgi:NTP pyrophosphatase (non-canonical NTP hydrolase)